METSTDMPIPRRRKVVDKSTKSGRCLQRILHHKCFFPVIELNGGCGLPGEVDKRLGGLSSAKRPLICIFPEGRLELGSTRACRACTGSRKRMERKKKTERDKNRKNETNQRKQTSTQVRLPLFRTI